VPPPSLLLSECLNGTENFALLFILIQKGSYKLHWARVCFFFLHLAIIVKNKEVQTWVAQRASSLYRGAPQLLNSVAVVTVVHRSLTLLNVRPTSHRLQFSSLPVFHCYSKVLLILLGHIGSDAFLGLGCQNLFCSLFSFHITLQRVINCNVLSLEKIEEAYEEDVAPQNQAHNENELTDFQKNITWRSIHEKTDPLKHSWTEI